ncbi:BREX-2 system phosphatase PglZ [Streptosporangium canum]|uniref:BREX-2 system phosphatase PglZ n=1 Tax=Streptosporangium canum TaxID=324952 RepID=UPI0037B0315B
MTVPSTIPMANLAVVEGELRRARSFTEKRNRPERVLLLRAAPEWRGDPDISSDGIAATVAACPTVLSVLDAISSPREPDTFLVVLTPCDDEEIGLSVLAGAIEHAVRPINRWDLVSDDFGAKRLDPRLAKKEWRWLAESLLDAKPRETGWRKLTGPVLTLETALNRLTAIRFGGSSDEEQLDAAALLEWTLSDAALTRFSDLRQEERDGLGDWLSETIGPVARVIFRMVKSGQGPEAVPLGLAVSELQEPKLKEPDDDVESDTSPTRVRITARVRAEERFFGGQAPSATDITSFAEACESLVVRWSLGSWPQLADDVCDRAQQILRGLGADRLAGASSILDAGFDARLAALTHTISQTLPTPRGGDISAIEEAWARLGEHRRTIARATEVEAAASAVRLTRWLALPAKEPGTLRDGATAYLREHAWVDRALAQIWGADTTRVPSAGSAYGALYEAVRECRAEFDRVFAERLAAWTESSAETEGLVLAENLLERIARPLAERRPPLIIVLDGMSAAVACELAEDIVNGRRWIETGRRDDGREPAIATIPSVTQFSRASLLCGTLRAGGQSEEKTGFTSFWRGRTSVLFHKGELRGGAGTHISNSVLTAIRDASTVVGVVLNTIDDALDRGREDGLPHWRLTDIAFLNSLLEEAWRVSRPVVLTSDHGHVLDRLDDIHPASADSARHRIGTPGDGEIEVRGRRVLSGPAVTVPWDERIRYTPRKAGYHGGVSPAEMVIPILSFVPTTELVPKGWTEYSTPVHAPAWWDTPVTGAPPATSSVKSSTKKKPRKQQPTLGDFLFEEADVPAAATLGASIATSALLAAQRTFVRRAPDNEEIAKLIDGLVTAGGKLPVTAAAVLVGQPVFRMSGYVAQVAKLLNVDGYIVIAETDGGRTIELNIALLREQFLGSRL